MSAIPDFFAVIPAGGVGSRLWPLSRASAPKFLHDLSGSGASLLADTWQRLVPLAGDQIMVVTGQAHAEAVRGQLPGLDESNLVLEPEPRESSAAIGLAAALLVRRNPDVVIGSFAADHIVRGRGPFALAVRQGVLAAQAGYITTIGITPTRPSTGFGYIKTADATDDEATGLALKVDSFVEKPDHATAVEYLLSGDYLWNAGMFISRADVLLAEIERTEPALHAGLLEIAAAWETDARDEVMARLWPTLTKVAIDFSVAEPAASAGRLVVVPGIFSWDDVGDFGSIARVAASLARDEVTTIGDAEVVYSASSSGLVVNHGSRIISLVGIRDVVVVDTPDALLVSTTDKAQEVKKMVEQLRAAGHVEVL